MLLSLASLLLSVTAFAQDQLGDPVQISAPQVLFGDVLAFQVSPDDSRAVYIADQNTDGVNELFSVPTAGNGPAVRLNPTILVFAGNVNSFRINPDGSRVVYLADQAIDDVNELFSVPIAGGTVERVNDTLPFSADVGTFVFSPNSQFIIYLADQDLFDEIELFSVALPQAPDETQLFVIPLPNGGAAVIPL